MALPKRRYSRTRGRKRRTHWTITMPNVVECAHCHQARLPHHICPGCGYYDGRKVIDTEADA